MTLDVKQLGIDSDALRARYRAERDKRLMTDGVDQFIEPSGDFCRQWREDGRLAGLVIR